MLPENFKNMFGIKDEKDLKMANNIWKMLDEMSSNDPQSYQKFIQKNLKEGLTDAKVQKQKKQKPYKLVPHQYMLIEMDAQLQEQYLGKDGNPQFKQKLDININKQKWSDVKSKFANKIRIYLNICHTDRIINPTSKSKNGEQIKQFNISMLKDIQNLYYSFQGPMLDDKDKNTWYFCIIFNTVFLRSFDTVPNGRRILLGLSVAYFQERLKADRNPVLIKVNTHALYGKNLYYGIDKSSIQVNQNKKFKYGKDQKVCQFLLQKQIDKKQIQQKQKQKKPNVEKTVQKNSTSNPIKTTNNQILIRPKQEQSSSLSSQLPPLIPTQQPSKKKVLIEVLDQKQFKDPKEDTQIPYQMKQTQDSYVIDFLVHGIEKIDELDLQVNSDTIKLKTLKQTPQGIQKGVEIKLAKKIDQNKVKAKMKKKAHTLQVTLNFIK